MHNGPRNKNIELANNFGQAIQRLFKELKKYKFLIIVACVLSGLGAALSISAPKRLTKLTDQISEGLVINKKNIDIINTNIANNNFRDFKIDDEIISSSDQLKYVEIMKDANNFERSELYKKMESLPSSIKNVIKPKMDLAKIKNISLVLLLTYVLSAVFTFIQSICMAYTSNGFAKDLRDRISKKINKLPLKYFDNHQTGDVLSRITNDVDTLAQSMNNSLSSLISNLVLFLGSIIMMFITNFTMAITAIISSLFGFIFMFIILGKSQKYFNQRQEELGNLNSHIEEVYSGLNIIKVYNAKYDTDKVFDDYNEKVSESNRKSQFLSGLMHPIMGFIGNFGYVAVCIVGALLTMNNKISFGVIIAFITYVRLFSNPLSQIAQSITSLQSTAAASERVFEFLDEKELANENNITNYLEKDKVKGNIEFKNVSFKYDKNGKTIINDFSAKVKSGQKIAIVGPTGAGKTTMVNLLMKFYDINDGTIFIDGVDIASLKRENIHELFTMVLQDTWLFEGTVKENIKYNKNISDSKIKDICKYIGLDHFIKTLPQSYNTLITESDSISSGQKQLMTIARGMTENAPFLILDEATSNVDTRTEELVSKAMDKLTKGKTSFIIAHRLSTIKNADLILVMNEGNIIEQGSHEQLMKAKGFYYKLYNSQFEL